ncbi:MAG: hypothetical protein KIT69_03095, partial [Propionibacteriaceae bacterium]|nr:hypothetical protein [Propionibacteriaceae bacterium]
AAPVRAMTETEEGSWDGWSPVGLTTLTLHAARRAPGRWDGDGPAGVPAGPTGWIPALFRPAEPSSRHGVDSRSGAGAETVAPAHGRRLRLPIPAGTTR